MGLEDTRAGGGERCGEAALFFPSQRQRARLVSCCRGCSIDVVMKFDVSLLDGGCLCEDTSVRV